MNEEQKPLISIELPNSKGKLEFWTIEDLDAWVKKECAFWQWLDKVATGNIAQYINQFRTRLQQMSRSVVEIKNNSKNPAQLAQQIQTLKNVFTELYVNFQLPSEPSGEREFVASLNPAGNSMIAVGALMVITRLRPDHNVAMQNDLAQGLISAVLFEKQINSANSEKSALDKLSGEYRNKFQDIVQETKGKLKELSDSSNNYVGQIAQQKADFDKEQKTRDDDLKKALDGFKKEMESIAKSFRLDLALDAPVQYWNSRAKSHFRRAVGFATLLIFLSASTVYLVKNHLIKILQPNFKLESWQIGTLAICAFLGIWVIRIVVRLFLSNVHLHTDAQQRGVMTQAYLALLENPKAITQPDQRIILEILFRPASTGIVRDDAAPPTPTDFITKKLGQ